VSPETVDALLEEYKAAARRYRDCRDGEGLDVLIAQAHVKLAALAWARAERELQAVTCPPPVPMLGRKLPYVDDGSPDAA
jgi:hypothetical protein